MRPCFECSGFGHYWYDEVEVVNNGFFVSMQYTSTSSAMKFLAGIWLSDLRGTLPMNDSCRVEICSSMLSISKNSLLTVSFIMH